MNTLKAQLFVGEAQNFVDELLKLQKKNHYFCPTTVFTWVFCNLFKALFLYSALHWKCIAIAIPYNTG